MGDGHGRAREPLTSQTALASLAAAYDREWASPDASQPYQAFWRFHDSARDRAEDLLGPVGGRRLLDLAAGAGASSLRFARRGATVFAAEISEIGLRTLVTSATAVGCKQGVRPVRADVERLPLGDASVDLVYGENFLMYVDPARLGAECRRVLRPGGRAVFLEPTAHHPLVRLYRRLLSPYRRTGPRYFSLDDLPRLGRHFAAMQHEEFYFLSLLALPVARRPALFALAYQLLDRLDRALFRLLPATRRLGWLTVIALYPDRDGTPPDVAPAGRV